MGGGIPHMLKYGGLLKTAILVLSGTGAGPLMTQPVFVSIDYISKLLGTSKNDPWPQTVAL